MGRGTRAKLLEIDMSWKTIVKENSLDISEISLEEVLKLNRLDGEYYKPLYLGYEKQITSRGYKEIQSFASITDGIHSSIDFDEQSTINLLSAMSPKDNYFDISRNKAISETQHKKNPRTELQEGDVIVSTVGTIGNCAVVDKTVLPANSDRHIGIIRVKSDYLPHFLSTFLLTKYGKFQTLREATGNVQLNLFIEKIRTLKVPITSNAFQKVISDTVVKALSLREQARNGYNEAEKLLLKEINLEGYVSSKENTSIRELTECLTDNRFDAEYWQLKFDGILERINAYTGGVSKIQDEFSQIKNNFKSDPETLYRYVEIGDVDVSTGEVSFSEMEGKELPANAKITLGEKQLVTSKVRPNRGATAILDNQKGYIASGAFVVLKEAGKVTLETLQVYLKTALIRDLLLRYNTGTAYPTIIDADILNLPLPLVNKNVQEAITEKVKQCSKERIEARELFEKAKRAVEIFIEKDEQEALKYLA